MENLSCCHLLLAEDALANYAETLGLESRQAALNHLAEAVAANPFWQQVKRAQFIISPADRPHLAILGSFSPNEVQEINLQLSNLNNSCRMLRYVNYRQVEQAVEVLAAKLAAQFGRKTVRSWHFQAIPRGGLIIQGLLAYALDLTPDNFHPHPSPTAPTVIIDDCALTGARFGRFLAGHPAQKVVFAHLFSHPRLRQAVEKQEPRVLACLAAHDLVDHGPDYHGQAYRDWQAEWLARLPEPRYWIGLTRLLAFPWNEAGRPIWNQAAGQIEQGWSLVPVEFSLRNRTRPAHNLPPLQCQPPAAGQYHPPPEVIYGTWQGRFVLYDTRQRRGYSLDETAAAMWQALLAAEDLTAATQTLLQQYDAEFAVLYKDLQQFWVEMQRAGLLVDDHRAPFDTD